MECIMLKFSFAPPPSLFLNALTVINLSLFFIGGFLEIRGKNAKYSKFFMNVPNSTNPQKRDSDEEEKTMVSSRTGMLICYVPALTVSLALLLFSPNKSIRMLLLKSTLALHFFKRIFEVLFVHRYSGSMILATAVSISISYLSSMTSMIYAQYLSQGLEEPPIDLKYIGSLLFLIGIIGNFYHHYLLSQIREKGDRKYKIPKGGLFDLVICPHYLFEIIGFVGFSFISQTLQSFSIAIGTMFYLLGRSSTTRQWYLSKFENFPQDVKALIPYVF